MPPTPPSLGLGLGLPFVRPSGHGTSGPSLGPRMLTLGGVALTITIGGVTTALTLNIEE